MKKVLLVLVLAAISVSAAYAETEIKVDGEVYVGVFDKYLWRGYDLSGSTPVVQGGIDLSAHNFTLSYWGNVQLKDDTDNGNYGETGYQGGDLSEAEIGIDYALPLGELVTLNVGNLYYPTAGENDTNELYLSGTFNTLLQPKLTVYHDWDENKDARFYTLEIGHSVEFGNVTLNASALGSYAEGADYWDASVETNEPWNTELGLSADIAVTEQFTVSPSFLYSAPLSDDARLLTDTEMAVGLTISHSF
jgi:hypothetical protein